MSVEIYRNEDDETVIDSIYIDGELPDIGELSSVKRIRYLSIRNVTDSKKLQELLSSISLTSIEKLEMTFCDLKDVDEQIFGKLQSVQDIYIEQNQGVNYNEIIRRIPNKELVRSLLLWADEKDKRNLNVQLLEGFKNLTAVGVRDFSQINMEALHTYLLGAAKLEEFIFAGNIESMDFISGVDLEHITIIDKGLDLGLITPEIAKTHKNIYFNIEGGSVIIDSVDNRKGYRLQLPLQSITRIEEMRETINGADHVRMIGNEVYIENEEQLQCLIENKELLLTAPWVIITVPHMGMIEAHQLQQPGGIRAESIRVMDRMCDEGVEEKFEYITNEYMQLYDKIQEIVGDIPEEATELQKFMIIYQRLGSTIVYDYPTYQTIKALKKNPNMEHDRGNLRSAGNLVNGLMRGTCVCAGYSDILYNCLNSVGIEACKITGEAVGIIDEDGDTEKHAWNKVKIDGVWYNVDLTWDCKDIVQHNARGLEHCLRSDEEFKEGHKQEYGKKVECNIDYPRGEIAKTMRFAEMFNDRALDAEYETITEESSFFDRLKARAMTLFSRRKMIEAPQTLIEVKTTQERRKEWLKNGGIVLHNGQELSTINLAEAARTKTPIKDREINDD